MTVPSTTNRNDYTGNGAVDTYPYSFKIFAEGDLLVTQRDDATPPIETTLVLNTGYTVTGAGETAGGTIVLSAGNLTTNYLLAIRRVVALTQETDIRNQGPFLPETHENQFDSHAMADQQQQNDLDRSMRLPETGTGVSTELPIPEALKFFRWDAAGTALEAVDAADLGTVSTFGPEFVFASSNLSLAIPNLQGVAGGTVDAITTTVSPTPASLTNNLEMVIEAAGANTITTPTFNPNSLGAKTIVKGSNTALVVGDIVGANFRMHLSFDTGIDKWVLLNPGGNATKAQVQSNSFIYVADTGVVNAYIATLVPAISGYSRGFELWVRIVNANTSTTPSLNVNGRGSTTIKRQDGTALLVGDLPAGHMAHFLFDLNFILLNPALIKAVDVPAGNVVQVAHAADGAVATGTTVMVVDNSKPQNDEGDEYITQAITPTNTNNKLVIEAVINISNDQAAGVMVVALFQDSTADALATVSHSFGAVNEHRNLTLPWEMDAGTTSSTTFKIRAGASVAGNTTFNGDTNGTAKFGGSMASTLRITERAV